MPDPLHGYHLIFAVVAAAMLGVGALGAVMLRRRHEQPTSRSHATDAPVPLR